MSQNIDYPYRLTDDQHNALKGVADTLYTLAGMGSPDDYRSDDAMTGCLGMLSDHLEKLLKELNDDSKAQAR